MPLLVLLGYATSSFAFFVNATSDMTILQFRESLLRSLLLDTPFEKLKIRPRQQSASRLKRKLADHKFEQKAGSTRDVRKRCDACYEKTRQQQRRD